MAYIINTGGSSGYTRADFVSALNGLQPLLQSGTNIKTINSQSVLGSGNLNISTQSYEYDLTQTELGLKSDTLSKLGSLDPNHEFFTFGFISDLHTMPKNPSNASEGNYVLPSQQEIETVVSDMMSNSISFDNGTASQVAQAILSSYPTTDESYYGASAEPSLRLLGAIGYEYGLDAVFCGGDLSSGRLGYDAYTYMLGYVKGLFEQYISVPYFITDGNHDRKYNSSAKMRTNAEWLKFLHYFNRPRTYTATYIDNTSVNGYVGNTYYVDFPSHKVRIIMASEYERWEGGGGASPYNQNLHDACQFSNTADVGNWIIGGVTHFTDDTNPNRFMWRYLNAFKSGGSISSYASDGGVAFPAFNGGYAGRANIGFYFGHQHAGKVDMENGIIREISVSNSEVTSKSPSSSGYTFSIFVVDTTNHKVHEVAVGRSYSTKDTYKVEGETGVYSFPFSYNS